MVAIRICHWQRHLRFVSFTLGRNCFFHACNSVTYIRKVSRIKEWWMRMSHPWVTFDWLFGVLHVCSKFICNWKAPHSSVTCNTELEIQQRCLTWIFKVKYPLFYFDNILLFETFLAKFLTLCDFPFLSQFKRGEGQFRHKGYN